VSGDYWKQQFIQDVLVPWTKFGRDEEYGSFHTLLDKDWKVGEKQEKYPGMIARHLFSNAVENGFLNMLYLDYWVNEQPVTLYYQINSAATKKLFPLLLEDFNYDLKKVLINGKAWEKIDQNSGSIHLPQRKKYKMEVVLGKK
jgi:hypothetical protein